MDSGGAWLNHRADTRFRGRERLLLLLLLAAHHQIWDFRLGSPLARPERYRRQSVADAHSTPQGHLPSLRAISSSSRTCWRQWSFESDL